LAAAVVESPGSDQASSPSPVAHQPSTISAFVREEARLLTTMPSVGTNRSMTLLAKRLAVVRVTVATASSRPFGDHAGAPSNRPGTSSIGYDGFPGRTANSFPP
jgi:hypothetical protein